MVYYLRGKYELLLATWLFSQNISPLASIEEALDYFETAKFNNPNEAGIWLSIAESHLLEAKWKKSPAVGMDNDIAKLDKIMDGWHDQLQSQGNMYLSPKQLQEIKTKLYKEINFD